MQRHSNVIIFNEQERENCLEMLPTPAFQVVDKIKITTGAIVKGNISEGEMRELAQEGALRGVGCYIGGGITERAIRKGSLSEHVKYLKSLGMDSIELSNAEGHLSNPEALYRAIQSMSGDFKQVLVEIGTKNYEDRFSCDYQAWGDSFHAANSAGADGIILEGSIGRVGIYEPYYSNVKSFLLLYLAKLFYNSGVSEKMIIEATIPMNIGYMVHFFGPNVKLGNISLQKKEFETSLRIRDDKKSYNGDFLQEYYKLIDEILDLCYTNNLSPNYFFFHSNYFNLDINVKDIREEVKWDIKKALSQPRESIYPPTSGVVYATDLPPGIPDILEIVLGVRIK